MKCEACGGAMVTEARAVRRYDIGGLSHVELHGVEVSRCGACGMEDVTIPRIEQLHRVLASAFITQTQPLAPAEIRFLRKYVGLSVADFAQYMGTARETVSRWETGGTPMGSTSDRLLRLLVITKGQIQDYAAVDALKDIEGRGTPRRPTRFRMRSGRDGWRRQLATA